MVPATLTLLLLALAHLASCRLAPTTGAHRLLLQVGDSTASTPDLNQQFISGQYILQLAEDVTNTAAAGEALVSEVQAAMAAAAPTVSNGVVTAAANQASSLKVLRTLGSSSSKDTGTAPGAAAAAASIGATGAAAAPSPKALLISAPDSALQHLRASKLVKAVIKDHVIAHQTVACVERQYLQKGISAKPAAGMKWPQCMTDRSKLVWRGSACGGGKISWVEVRAVDMDNNAPIMADGLPCVLSLSNAKGGATWVRQRFGGCGTPPAFARSLPTRICSATGGNPSSSSNPAAGGTELSASPAPVEGNGTPGAPGAPTFVLPRVPLAANEQVPAGIARIEAASAAGAFNTAGLSAGQQVVVGIVDSGVDGTHPDLNLVGGSTWVTPSAKVAGDVADADVDKYGHGTHVAGVIGARNNGAGVVGVAPALPLYSLKVLDAEGVGALSDAMAAVEWAASAEGQVKANIRVINLSLAAYVSPTDPDYQATVDVVCASFKTASDAGIVVVAAAGNYGSDLRGYLPASCPTVVAVASMDPGSNAPSSFSNYLPANALDAAKARVIAAPGNAILSTISYFRDASGYRELSGTSMASPHVAGVAATCFMSGACPISGVAGISQLATLQAAAQERLGLSNGFGFEGDASSTSNGKYYGSLLWAKF